MERREKGFDLTAAFPVAVAWYGTEGRLTVWAWWRVELKALGRVWVLQQAAFRPFATQGTCAVQIRRKKFNLTREAEAEAEGQRPGYMGATGAHQRG